MSDLAHLSQPVRHRGGDLRALLEVFLGMQVLAALIWTGFMTFRPMPDVHGAETSVRGAVMEALAEHLTPVSTPVLVERPQPRKTAAPVLKPARKPSPAPAGVATWEPPAPVYAPPPPAYIPPAPRYYAPPAPSRAPAPRASAALSAPQRAWLSVTPPKGEH